MGLSDEQIDRLVRLDCIRQAEKNLRPLFSCTQLYRSLEDTSPQHVVYLDAFYIDRYEVTNEQYRACVSARVCTPPVSNYFYVRDEYSQNPVDDLSWLQADTYCRWVGKRLPSEAEWEKAARGSDGRLFPWGNEFDPSRANLCDVRCPLLYPSDLSSNDGYVVTAPVGSYPDGVSPYGVYDMLGNVWEWTADWYVEDYYAVSPTQNPSGPEYGGGLVARGGGFLTSPAAASTATRSYDMLNSPPPYHQNSLGMRCAMDAPLTAVVSTTLPPPAPALLLLAPGDGVVEGWAVLAAQEHYGGLVLLEDQEAGFGYLDEFRETLIQAGWAADHIRIIRDEIDRDSLSEAVRWLAQSADGDDRVLFYTSAESKYLDRYLRWHAFFPPLWAEVPGQRVLIVDTCDGEYFARAVSGDGHGGLAIGSVRGRQCGWFGLAADGTEFTGPAFTHYFLAALQQPAADADSDGRVSVQEAARYADAAQRAYIRETILPVAEFHRRLAAPWADDFARDPNYPSAWIGDWVRGPVFLGIGFRES